MGETTTPAQTSDDLWNKARDAGLFSTTQGTNAFDRAIDHFAAAVRASTPAAKNGGSAFPNPEIHDSFPRESVGYTHCHAECGLSVRAYFAAHLDVPYEEVVSRIKAGYPSYNNTKYPSLREIAVQRAAMRILEADALIRLLDRGQA